MTSIREQLAGKARRRVVVPVQMSESAGDEDSWAGAATALRLAEHRRNEAEDDQARELAQAEVDSMTSLLEERTAAIEGHFAQVELQALPSDEWEAAEQQWHDGDKWDWGKALPPLLAASCTDAELQDEAFWADTLKLPEWGKGDKDGLIAGLLHLNVIRADLRVPKG